MFLPQVVKSARVMKNRWRIYAVYWSIKKKVTATNGENFIGKREGDVHDIGKNIVGVVLACNNFEIIDIGWYPIKF